MRETTVSLQPGGMPWSAAASFCSNTVQLNSLHHHHRSRTAEPAGDAVVARGLGGQVAREVGQIEAAPVSWSQSWRWS